MSIPHNKFCVLPWISLEASPIGTVRPCCLADDELKDDNGNKFDLNFAKFSDIQNSTDMQALRQAFVNGEQPKTCRKCWSEEDAGRSSKRMHTLNRLRHIISDQQWTVDAKPLQFLDLKLGTICNLKCRICGSWSSSLFAAEEIANLPAGADRKNNIHYQMLRAGAWPRENPVFWSEIADIVDQLRYIEFTGGEPFLIQEHFDMLQRLVDRGIAGQIEIHYNTNGTQWPEQGEQIWKHFKTVEIAFSIDDVGSRFEYQRSNAVWAEVVDNIEKFKQLQKNHSNIQLQACCTVNVFNVYYLETVAKWLAEQNFNFVYWNMLHDADYLSIATLPDSAKLSIAEQLKSARVNPITTLEFQRIVDFMQGGVSQDGTVLHERLAEFDRRRNQNLALVEPEFAQLINYDGPN